MSEVERATAWVRRGPQIARDEKERTYEYGVYEVTGGHLGPQPAPRLIASCDGDSLAFTLDTLRAEGQIDGDTRLGILVRCDGDVAPGRWLVNPYARGR